MGDQRNHLLLNPCGPAEFAFPTARYTNAVPTAGWRTVRDSGYRISVNNNRSFDISFRRTSGFRVAVYQDDRFITQIWQESETQLRVHSNIFVQGHDLIQRYTADSNFAPRVISPIRLTLRESSHLRRLDLRYNGTIWVTWLIAHGTLVLATPGGGEVCAMLQALLEVALQRGVWAGLRV